MLRRGAGLPRLGAAVVGDRAGAGRHPGAAPAGRAGRAGRQPGRYALRRADHGADPAVPAARPQLDAAAARAARRCGWSRCPARRCRPSWPARTRRRFGDVLYNLYGSTEVAYASIATPADLAAAPGSVGKPPYGTTVKLLDAGRHRRCRAGESGRIFVGSTLQFGGYTGGGSKEQVAGLMSTGDLGHLDADGRLFDRRPRRRHDRLRWRERVPGRGRGAAGRPRRHRRGRRGAGRRTRSSASGCGPSWCRRPAADLDRGRRQGLRARPTWPGTRCRGTSTSSTSCRATRPARSSNVSCLKTEPAGAGAGRPTGAGLQRMTDVYVSGRRPHPDRPLRRRAGRRPAGRPGRPRGAVAGRARAPELDPAGIDDVFFGDANGAGEDNRDVARMAVLLAGLPTSVPGRDREPAVRLRAGGGDRGQPGGRGRRCVAGHRRRRRVDEPGAVGAARSRPRAFRPGTETLHSTTLGWRMVNPAMPAEWTCSLGECTELLAEKYGITRQAQDEFALASHQKADRRLGRRRLRRRGGAAARRRAEPGTRASGPTPPGRAGQAQAGVPAGRHRDRRQRQPAQRRRGRAADRRRGRRRAGRPGSRWPGS